MAHELRILLAVVNAAHLLAQRTCFRRLLMFGTRWRFLRLLTIFLAGVILPEAVSPIFATIKRRKKRPCPFFLDGRWRHAIKEVHPTKAYLASWMAKILSLKNSR